MREEVQDDENNRLYINKEEFIKNAEKNRDDLKILENNIEISEKNIENQKSENKP